MEMAGCSDTPSLNPDNIWNLKNYFLLLLIWHHKRTCYILLPLTSIYSAVHFLEFLGSMDSWTISLSLLLIFWSKKASKLAARQEFPCISKSLPSGYYWSWLSIMANDSHVLLWVANGKEFWAVESRKGQKDKAPFHTCFFSIQVQL